MQHWGQGLSEFVFESLFPWFHKNNSCTFHLFSRKTKNDFHAFRYFLCNPIVLMKKPITNLQTKLHILFIALNFVKIRNLFFHENIWATQQLRIQKSFCPIACFCWLFYLILIKKKFLQISVLTFCICVSADVNWISAAEMPNSKKNLYGKCIVGLAWLCQNTIQDWNRPGPKLWNFKFRESKLLYKSIYDY